MGLLSSFALMVPMILSLHGAYVDSACSEGEVVCGRPIGSIGSVWRGAGVRTVHVVHGL